MSDWTTIDIKKKKKAVGTGNGVICGPGGIKQISKAEIMSVRHLYTEVTYKLSELFDNINEMVNTSSQYQHSKNINHNQHNHNVWHSKKATDYDIDIQVMALFNKATDTNVQDVIARIKVIVITNYSEMKNVVNRIYNKCLNDTNQVLLYIKIVKYIMLNCSWIVYDDRCKPISFRKILIDKLETDFNAIIDSVKSGEEVTEELRLHRTAFFNTIGALLNESIIGNQLYRFILDNLQKSFLREHNGKQYNNEYMEYWLTLITWAKDIWTGDLREYIKERQQFVDENVQHFGKRVEVLATNLSSMSVSSSSSFIVEQEAVEKPKKERVDTEDEYKGYNISMLIDSIEEYSSKDEWFDEIFNLTDTGTELVERIIYKLSHKTSNLKNVFGLLKFFKKKKEYKDYVTSCVNNFSANTTCVAYVNNAKKLNNK